MSALQGLEGVIGKFHAKVKQIDANVAKENNRTAQKVRASAIRNISRGGRSGIVYEKYNPRRTHQASAEGEFPKTDTGGLVASVKATVDGQQGVVYTDLDYGAFLELVMGRAWLEPSLREHWDDHLTRVSAAMKKVTG